MKFLLDTNFLMAVGQFKIDVFEQLSEFGRPEIYTLDLVVEELEKLKAGKGRKSRSAKLALNLIEQKDIRVLKSRESLADDELVRQARMGYTVCTQDRELLERLKKKGFPAIRIIQKKTLSKA